jgi:hypothetical protein
MASRIERSTDRQLCPFLRDSALRALLCSGPALPGRPEKVLRAAVADALGDLALMQFVRGGFGQRKNTGW